ncbi:MAG TPA: class 1 fructose-bisphosphatase, partial [Methylomirabilota bacterium]|nr:class 1 fructose-bisphosphatase [Methylomirabilota bacterium]
MTAGSGAPLTPTPLGEHLSRARGQHAADLGAIVGCLAEAGVTIARELGRAALVGRLGTTGTTNVQGETVKKLDLWANDVVVQALGATGRVATLVSEEMEDPLRRPVRGSAPWTVCFDPVDGSSNLDVNGVVGTIFSVRPGDAPSQPGTAQVAAGYIMYGPSTVLVLATDDGVDAFTLDVTIGRFLHSLAKIRIPPSGHIYS